MNNGKYYTEQYAQKQSEKTDRLYGIVATHKKLCESCGLIFDWVGRLHTKMYRRVRFCSRSCSNKNNGAIRWRSEQPKNYRTICFQFYAKRCILCGFDKVVSVHHLDQNHENNEPGNLVPICSNHHTMIHHSEWGSRNRH